jgi:hypothetical protein
MNLGNTIRQKFRSILANPRGYSDEEIAAMRSIVRGSYTQDALRIAGNILGGGGGLGSLASAAAGHAAEGMAGAIGFPAMGMGVRQLGNMLTVRKVNALDEMIRSRSPLAGDMAAQQAERDAAKRWATAYINSQANPTAGNVRALNATSRGLALILNRNMGVDVQKAIPWLQNPAAGVAAQPQQNEVPGEPGERHDGGGVGHEQGRAQGGHVATLRAHGGRVNAANIDHNPTEAEKKAGNYAKDHVHIHGLDIAIENAKGHARTGTDKGGKPWSVKMPAHYGYVKKTEGKDGDHVDVYLGPHLKSPKVFVIDQKNAETGGFDEHKTFLGFASEQQVRACYAKAFSDGKAHKRLGHIEEMTVEAFKHWLENGDTTKPIKNGEDKKLPHAAVAYVAHSRIPGKHCGACSMFVEGGPHCTLVADPIAAGGYCRRFRSASVEQDHAA